MFIIMLIRRFGLAIGAYFLVFYLTRAIADLSLRSMDPDNKYGLAIGAAIFAFFLPKPAFKDPQSPNK